MEFLIANELSILRWVHILAMVYWLGGELYLIDANKVEMPLWQGIVLSAVSLTIARSIPNNKLSPPLPSESSIAKRPSFSA